MLQEAYTGGHPPRGYGEEMKIIISASVQIILDQAFDLARKRRHEYITAEHVL